MGSSRPTSGATVERQDFEVPPPGASHDRGTFDPHPLPLPPRQATQGYASTL